MIPANISLFKVNNRNTRRRCEICSKLTIETPEWRRARVFFLMKLQDLRPEDVIVAGGFGDWWTMALIFECGFLVSHLTFQSNFCKF